jgi:hypothetical protein
VWPAAKDNNGGNFSFVDNLFEVELSGMEGGKAMWGRMAWW